MAEAHPRFKSNTDGVNSKVHPALERMPADLFGICVVGASGNVYEIGDADHPFSIMSVSKPFLFAMIAQALGAKEVRRKVGAADVELTGYALRHHDRTSGKNSFAERLARA